MTYKSNGKPKEIQKKKKTWPQGIKIVSLYVN